MGLVWPEYLNASTTELRSSIPVHITQEVTNPPPGKHGRQRVWGMETRGWLYVGQGLESISLLFSITEDSIGGDTTHFFLSNLLVQ